MRIFTRSPVSLRLMVCLAVSLLLALPAGALARSTRPARAFTPAKALKAHASTKKALEEGGAEEGGAEEGRAEGEEREAEGSPAAHRDQGDRGEGGQAAGSADRLRHARGPEADRAATTGSRTARRTHDRACHSDGPRPAGCPGTDRVRFDLPDGRSHRRPDARSGRADRAGGDAGQRCSHPCDRLRHGRSRGPDGCRLHRCPGVDADRRACWLDQGFPPLRARSQAGRNGGRRRLARQDDRRHHDRGDDHDCADDDHDCADDDHDAATATTRATTTTAGARRRPRLRRRPPLRRRRPRQRRQPRRPRRPHRPRRRHRQRRVTAPRSCRLH